MRVFLVGVPGERDYLRRQLGTAAFEIVGEYTTVETARSSGVKADAILIPIRQAAGDGPDEALTPREIEVLGLLTEGLPNKAIARRLGISDQTVKFHVAAICGKMGAANRTDVVRRAIRRGLVAV
jgi:DNA-binding CsgD family transcriptional regulator